MPVGKKATYRAADGGAQALDSLVAVSIEGHLAIGHLNDPAIAAIPNLQSSSCKVTGKPQFGAFRLKLTDLPRFVRTTEVCNLMGAPVTRLQMVNPNPSETRRGV